MPGTCRLRYWETRLFGKTQVTLGDWSVLSRRQPREPRANGRARGCAAPAPCPILQPRLPPGPRGQQTEVGIGKSDPGVSSGRGQRDGLGEERRALGHREETRIIQNTRKEASDKPLRLIKINPLRENEFQKIHGGSLRFSACRGPPTSPPSDLGPLSPASSAAAPPAPWPSTCFLLHPSRCFHEHTLEFSLLFFIFSLLRADLSDGAMISIPRGPRQSRSRHHVGEVCQPAHASHTAASPAGHRHPHDNGRRAQLTSQTTMHVCGRHVETPSYKLAPHWGCSPLSGDC